MIRLICIFLLCSLFILGSVSVFCKLEAFATDLIHEEVWLSGIFRLLTIRALFAKMALAFRTRKSISNFNSKLFCCTHFLTKHPHTNTFAGVYLFS